MSTRELFSVLLCGCYSQLPLPMDKKKKTKIENTCGSF